MSEIFKNSLEIRLISTEGQEIEDVDPKKLEGLSLMMEGVVVGHYRDVRKLQVFTASLVLITPVSPELRRKLEGAGQVVWIPWPRYIA